MKKSLRIFITAAICIFSVTAAAADDWKVVFLRDEYSGLHKGVAFHKNGKKAFALTDWEMPHTMVFVKQDRKNPSHFEPIHIYHDTEKSFNYKDYLLDIKGDGDYRYLIVYTWHGGNSPYCEDGYLIDTKDNFAIIGRVNEGGSESCSLSYPNPEFTFTYSDEIASFGANGSAVILVTLKIQKGKEPVLVSTVAKEDSFGFKYMFQECREILADKDRPQNREIAFADFYCDLASYGLLKDLNKYAKQLGFADDEIKEYRNYYLERIKESRFYKYIYKLNRPEDFADDWKVVFLKEKDSNLHIGVEFHKNSKKAFGIKFTDTGSSLGGIGFMVPMGDEKTRNSRFEFQGIGRSDEKSFNYKDYLIDMKGNGDKRYLLIGYNGGGNRGSYNNGYLIDTKDNFAVIGRVPIGECYDYPMPNNELIFRHYDTIEHFSRGAEASVFIKYKLQKGKMPLVVEQAGDIRYFSLEEYEKILEDKNWSESRKYTLAKLYCDLASKGSLKHFCISAQRLGFSNDEIAEAGEYYGEKLKKSKLYKYIKKLNDNLQIRDLISDDEAFFQDWLSAIADPDMASSATMNWSREFNYNVVYVGNGFVSYYCKADYYTGGAHRNHDIYVGTLYRGKGLHLADLPELDKIEKLFQQALRSRKDFKEIREYNCGKEIKMTENFYIDAKGIHFIYAPYEIHCYGAGIIDVFVPYKVDFGAN